MENKFKTGQRVKMYDSDDKQTVFGRVVNVVTDIPNPYVSIDWEDLTTSTEHYQDEWDDITIVT